MKIFTNISENIPKNCFTSIGFFDGVHLGHRYIIERLKLEAFKADKDDLLITLWPHPSFYFGKQVNLLTTLDEKIKLISDLGVNNLLILEFNHELAGKSGYDFVKDILIDNLNISGLVMGYNNSFGKNKAGASGIDIGMVNIVRLDEFRLSDNIKISSSIIRDLLMNGDAYSASNLLSYKYELNGVVEYGYQIGRRLGFPTANLSNFDVDKVIPADGVYIVEAEINGNCLPAMLNIGVRPTFEGDKRTIELHVIDFEGDLYLREVTIRFIKQIRLEQKFDSPELLVEQLYRDREITRKYFSSI